MFGGGRTATRSPAPAARPPMHHQQQHAPAQQHAPPQGGGMMSGLGGAVATGMAMGVGSEIAHQAVRGMMGSGSSGHGGENNNAPAQQQQ